MKYLAVLFMSEGTMEQGAWLENLCGGGGACFCRTSRWKESWARRQSSGSESLFLPWTKRRTSQVYGVEFGFLGRLPKEASSWEEAPGQIQIQAERLYLRTGQGTTWIPQGKGQSAGCWWIDEWIEGESQIKMQIKPTVIILQLDLLLETYQSRNSLISSA